MVILSVKKLFNSMGVLRYLSFRRFCKIDRLLDGRLINNDQERIAILDVGCAIGKDFVQFLGGRDDVNIYGIDLKDYGLRQSNFCMMVCDAANLPFPDSHFDIAVSIGVIEHISPIEKLVKVAQEIDRVSKSFVVIVPSINTIIEPHIVRLFWQLRNRNIKPSYSGTLIYMSDDAWLDLGAFRRAKSCRYDHIPLLVKDLIIYKDIARQVGSGDA